MDLLRRLEQRLDRTFRGGFARAFGGAVEPAEVAAALRQEAEDRRLVLGTGRVLVPSAYEVALAHPDHERLAPVAGRLAEELASGLAEHASARGWTTWSAPRVTFVVDESLVAGVLEVRAGPEPSTTTDDAPVGETSGAGAGDRPRGRPRVVVRGADGTSQEHALPWGTTVLGRGRDGTDVRLVGGGVSRRHAELRVDADGVLLVDLGSTNGTRVDGRPVARRRLVGGERLRLGDVDVELRVDR